DEALDGARPAARAAPRGLDEVRRAPDVDREELVGASRLGEARRVDDRVDPVDRLADALDVFDTTLEELDVRELLEVLLVRRLSHARANAVAAVREQLGDGTAEKAACACDEDLHVEGAPFVRGFS